MVDKLFSGRLIIRNYNSSIPDIKHIIKDQEAMAMFQLDHARRLYGDKSDSTYEKIHKLFFKRWVEPFIIHYKTQLLQFDYYVRSELADVGYIDDTPALDDDIIFDTSPSEASMRYSGKIYFGDTAGRGRGEHCLRVKSAELNRLLMIYHSMTYLENSYEDMPEFNDSFDALLLELEETQLIEKEIDLLSDGYSWFF